MSTPLPPGFARAAGQVALPLQESREQLAVLEKSLTGPEAIATYLTQLELSYPTSHVQLEPAELEEAKAFKRQKYAAISEKVRAEPALIGDAEHNWIVNLMNAITLYPGEQLDDLFKFILQERSAVFTSSSLHVVAIQPAYQIHAQDIIQKRRDLADAGFATEVFKWIVSNPRHPQDRLVYANGVLTDILNYSPASVTETNFGDFINMMKREFRNGRNDEGLGQCVRIATQIVLHKKPGLREVWKTKHDPAWEKFAATRSGDESRLAAGHLQGHDAA